MYLYIYIYTHTWIQEEVDFWCVLRLFDSYAMFCVMFESAILVWIPIIVGIGVGVCRITD